MLGTELSRLFDQQDIPYIGTDREVNITSRAGLDLFVLGKPITWIINCAAYTAVDKAEDEVELCRQLNTVGPANIAETAKSIGARLIHISSDYVFNGRGSRPYRETDQTDPIGVYGLTKRDGEVKVAGTLPDHYILRTAWLYGAFGNNFVSAMLRLMNSRESISVVNDQRGNPTWARDLAELILTLIQKVDAGREIPYGIYHFSGEDFSGNNGITWFDFASAIYRTGRERGLLTKACAVLPCTSDEFPAKVRRPAYSVLDKTKIKTAWGIAIPDWQESLEEFLKLCEV
jgi:dTDP-4-dehydrorhamnose reductase